MNFLQKIHQLHYKEFFLVGFYISFIIITSIAAIADAIFGDLVDMTISIASVGLCILFFIYYLQTKNHQVAARAIFWIGSTVMFIFMYHNRFDIIVVFALLLPIAACVMMSPRETFINISFYYIALGILLVFGYYHFEYHPLLHNPQEMTTYIIALLFTIAFGVFYNFSIENSHRTLERANAEKEILLKEIHHRVKNNLNVIASIVDLQARANGDDTSTQQLHLTQGRIESIAIVHEMLYQKQQDLAQIHFQDYMHKLALMVERLHVMLDVEYHIQGDNIMLPIHTMLDLGLITNELLTNTHKHAFATTMEPKISISLKSTGPEQYRYRYHDNGIGIAHIDHTLECQSLGLRLIRLSAQKMDAHLSVTHADGFLATIDFTLPTA